MTKEITIAGIRNAPFLEQYFGAWAVLESVFMGGIDRLKSFDLNLHLKSAQAAEAMSAGAQGGSYEVANEDIAVIYLSGSLMKQESSFSAGTSTVLARRKIRAAVNNDNIAGILLHIDSPGGTVSGTRDLADEVAAASKKKPVYAYAEDLMASAAYWVGSQATKVFCNPTAIVGSIGTFMVLEDSSQQAAQEGVKVHVIRAGDFKGVGVPGTVVGENAISEWQSLVDQLNAHFIAGISAGRNLPADRVKQLADGRVHVGEAAQSLGLVDGVQSLDDTLSALVAASSPKKRKKIMSAENDTQVIARAAAELKPAAATLAQIKAACQNADASFVMAQLEANSTLDDVRANWSAKLQSDLAASKAENERLKALAEKPGVAPVTGSGKKPEQASFDGDPIAAWDIELSKKLALGMKKDAAVKTLVREQKDLHAAYIATYNEQRKSVRA